VCQIRASSGLSGGGRAAASRGGDVASGGAAGEAVASGEKAGEKAVVETQTETGHAAVPTQVWHLVRHFIFRRGKLGSWLQ